MYVYTIGTCTSHPPLFLQVTLPVAITPRRGHSAVVFGSGASFRVVVLFGGQNLSDYLSETTLLLLGECTISATDLSTQVHAVIFYTPPPSFYCYFTVQCFSGSSRCEALGLRKQVIMLYCASLCLTTCCPWDSISTLYLHTLSLHIRNCSIA